MTLKRKGAFGAAFLFTESPGSAVTPEGFTEEQMMMAETTRQFIEKSVVPHDQKIEGLDYELTLRLLKEAGSLGLLGADVPEAFGGLGLDKVSATLINESLAKASSFALSASVHTGIGTLPIVFFGSPDQKKKYLPELAAGTKIAAYCLTEPSSGSDALSAKTTARLSDDGKYYVLNGEKQFITNAGFADIFIVYARIDGKGFSAFIVERNWDGVSLGPEEKKMGIKGSSTRPVILEDVRVPAGNLLGEAGRGHVIAFNILNIGRFKLATLALGSAKEAIALSTKFANEREQFGRPIASFPLIREKLADMNIRTYALESVIYRTAGLIDQSLATLDYNSPDSGKRSASGIAEYAIECSINKVLGSETLDFVADEGVQIHGGYGFISEYKIERIYRDSRINRIFEGTNEINRLVISSTLLKKAAKGELPLLRMLGTLESDIEALIRKKPVPGASGTEEYLVAASKKILLYVLGLATRKFDQQLQQEQLLIKYFSDMMIAVYTMESVLIRSMQIQGKEDRRPDVLTGEMMKVYVHEGFEEVTSLAKKVLAYLEKGETLTGRLITLDEVAVQLPIDSLKLKMQIGQRVAEAGKYLT